MRTFFFALAAIVPAFAIDRAGAADELPAFDIARNCREEVIGAITTVDSCTKDETDAKNELTKRWSQFGASDKKSCIGEASIGTQTPEAFWSAHIKLMTRSMQLTEDDLVAVAIDLGVAADFALGDSDAARRARARVEADVASSRAS